MATVEQVVKAIETLAPLSLQESWDNSGLQVGHPEAGVTGVLVTLDPTPERIDEAIALGANMVVSHHPLIFKGLKSITDSNRTQRAVEKAVKGDIAVYSAHTSLDNARGGVSAMIAQLLRARIAGPLVPTAPGEKTGTGVVCEIEPMSVDDFVSMVKDTLKLKVIRTSDTSKYSDTVRRFAACGGSGGSFIGDAIAAGAQAYITGDIRYHDFIDYADKICLIDCGHFETEMHSRSLMAFIIKKMLPEIPVHISVQEKNPVNYI